MSEKPIICSGPMVRAILDGTKTQDRRVLKPAKGVKGWPETMWPVYVDGKRAGESSFDPSMVPIPAADGGFVWTGPSPIATGDRLWVRETWSDAPMSDHERCVAYQATGDYLCGDKVQPADPIKWRPSIHMPRWASRISLLVTAVKVERLQEISEADAQAEGCAHPEGQWAWDVGGSIDHFADVWQGINAKRPGCSWTDNPWVAAIRFEVMR